ncbi:MAG: ATPase, T2SS/T4P/T4SS family [Endomicrobiia bacterium]|nr:ATPase, T2SS/T4P/T4SS family [Endomicrobiia bacterium]
MSGRRKTVKEILLDKKLVNEEQLNQALAEAKKTNQPLEQAVARLGFIDRLALLKTLSIEWGVKSMDLDAIEIDPEVVKIIPEQLARRHRAVPFIKEEEFLCVAMADPKDLFAVEDIQLRTNISVQVYLALPDDIAKCLDKAYGIGESDVVKKLLSDIDKGTEGELDFTPTQTQEQTDINDVDATAPEVEKLVNAIIMEALSRKCSDIHIEPLEKKFIVRYRVDGVLTEWDHVIPPAYKNALIAKLKIMTNQMDITERRRPQDGRIQVIAKGNPIEFRVNILPTVFGESCVMRILDRSSVQVDLVKLGFLPDTFEKFKKLLAKPYGLILVCGPTGSGKSTTLYAALNSINEPDTKILTAENPVEYNLNGIIQVNVVQDIGFDFATALRAFLRQDPDIIMVGEIRDKETAQIAMEAAMTGHLVFSTIHTNDAPSAVARLHEMDIPSFLIGSSIEGVLAQRLIRRLCKCKQPAPLEDKYIEPYQKYNIDIKGATFFKTVGCDVCRKTGYKGRLGIHELLLMDEELRRLLLSEIAAGPIRDLAVKRGMRLMFADGLIKVAQGNSTIEELLASVQ